MKRLLPVALAVLSLGIPVSASTSGSLSCQPGGDYLVEAGDGVADLRSGPSSEADVLSLVPNGNQVQVKAQATNAENQVWCELTSPYQGWIFSGLLRRAQENTHRESVELRDPPVAVQAPPAVAARANVNWGPWLADLKRRTEESWKPLESGASRRTVVVFSVGRNGSISNPRISQSSGHPPTDDGALQAVSEASPYRPLPVDYEDDAVTINFTFDINVVGQLEASGGEAAD